jgi:hypothetical protein
MVCIGEQVGEGLDIVTAKSFALRRIRGNGRAGAAEH